MPQTINLIHSEQQYDIKVQMSFNRLTSFFKSKNQSKNEQPSILEQGLQLFSLNRRASGEQSRGEFDEYLANIPDEYLQSLKIAKPKTQQGTASLKLHLVRRCYQNVPSAYFQFDYSIDDAMFTRNRKTAQNLSSALHDNLDQVEVALFNQITCKFDQILSVLRTIESLDCLVMFNANRLKEMRQGNMKNVKKVSSKLVKIATTNRKKENIEKVLTIAAKLRNYRNLIKKQNSKGNRTDLYESLSSIRSEVESFNRLSAASNFTQKLDQVESQLKQSFTDTINDSFFMYVVSDNPYSPKFWHKFENKPDIFEADEDNESLAILDQSMMAEEDTGMGGIGLKGNIKPDVQDIIKDNLVKGWQEGQYSGVKLKAAIEKFSKQVTNRFLSDCRNFCMESCMRTERKVENPSIGNLLQKMSISFCSKSFTYFCDLYRNLLLRTFSLTFVLLSYLLTLPLPPSIDQRQKLATLSQSLMLICVHVFKIVYQKVVEVIQMKTIGQATDINDFKLMVNVIETEEEWVSKYLQKYVDWEQHSSKFKESFLWDRISGMRSKCNFDLLKKAKYNKTLTFLNRYHRFTLQNELKQSLQNQIWIPQDIPTFYYDSLHYLITGESLNLRRNKNHTMRHNASQFDTSVLMDPSMIANNGMGQKSAVIGDFRIIRTQIIVSGRVYRVTSTVLLVVQFLQDYMHLSQYYPDIRKEVGMKVCELIRAYNSSTTQLIVNAGAVALGKIKTKNINAKQLALSSLCISFISYLLDCISKRLEIPDQKKIRKELEDHEQTILRKLTTILQTKVTHSLPQITLNSSPSKGTQAIVSSTKILHDILLQYYPKAYLSRIFTKDLLKLYLNKIKSIEIKSKMQVQALKDDIGFYFNELQFLADITEGWNAGRIQAQDKIRMAFQSL